MGFERGGAAFAHVAEAGDDGNFTGEHHVGGAFEAIGEGFAAAVEIVEFGFGDGVVHVDGGNFEFAFFYHFMQAVHTGGGFFGNAFDGFEHFGVFIVHDHGDVAAVVEDHVGGPAIGAFQCLLNAPFVFFFGFAFPCEDGDACGGDGGGGLILRGEDVAAAPAHFRA